jgi:hypothetical protein
MRFARTFSLTATAAVFLVLPIPVCQAMGLEIMVAPGYGSAGDKSPVVYKPTGLARMDDATVGSIWNGTTKPYGAGFSVDGALGYRALTFLSFGVAGGWRQSQASSSQVQAPLSNASRSGLQVGFYARGYVPLVGKLLGFDPWASVGAAYVYDKQSYNEAVAVAGLGDISMPVELSHHGVGIPLGLGIDYHLLPFLAVGPSFRYEPVIAVAGCMSTHPTQPNVIGASYCSNADARERIAGADSYGVWSLQLELRLAI